MMFNEFRVFAIQAKVIVFSSVFQANLTLCQFCYIICKCFFTSLKKLTRYVYHSNL